MSSKGREVSHTKTAVKTVSSALVLSLALSQCSQDSTPAPEAELQEPAVADLPVPADAGNPLLQVSGLPYDMPAFDRIRNEHYLPAYEQAMQIHQSEIQAIATLEAAPDFENTIVAMERVGQDLSRVARIFNNVNGAHTNPDMQAVQRELAPRLAAHNDSISLNQDLFERVSAVYEQRDQLALDAESYRLLERYYTDFVRSGARLDEAQKDRLREINSQLAALGASFSQNVLADVNASAVVVDTREELAGLSEAQIQAAADTAASRGLDGKYVITLLNTSGQPPLAQLENRALRERIFKASIARGSRGAEFDTTGILSETLKLRAERAQMLGFATHADFVLAEQTAGSTQVVNDLLSGMAPVAVANARAEGAEIQRIINETEAEPFELQAWDWDFYAEKVRRERYAFDESEVRPYFELNSVLQNGVFYAAGQVYGLSFVRRDDLPTYHPDVQVWEVFDKDGRGLGIMLGDFYSRSSKRGGAWMNSYNIQSGLLGGNKVIGNHLNITKPPAGEPTLMTFDEVTTLFHEFGHVLHGLFSDVTYPRFAGTAVPRDFVEFPSQVNEMWATWPQVLENYARHYQTGERIPQVLLDKVMAAAQFNEGFRTTEYLAASIIDMALHQLPPEQIPAGDQVMDFEAQVLRDAGLDYAPVPPRYRAPYFSHIMGGYAAGYYSYIWSEVLDADAVQWFEENGGMTRENGDHFRDTLLSLGGSEEAMTIYRNFAGREPDMSHMLRRRGLLNE
ncbi:MAG: M3 family metallopeptidase [Gammaproteobacteria bacterium]|nr:M3 family metallopeptidase [Gammaproteobacteria bacterium]